MRRFIHYSFLTLFLLYIFIPAVNAQIKSPQYKINEPYIGIDNTDRRLKTTLTKAEFNEYDQRGYIIRENEPQVLRGTLSHTNLTFKNEPGQADNISTVLTITSSRNNKYQALVQAHHPLRTVWGDTIPHTSCDNGCTINVARPWKNVESVGFGYTLKGDDIPEDFKDISYYRPFPDRSLQETPRTIMLGTFDKDTKQSTLVFRVNNSQDQPDGTYQTIVDIFVSPLY